MGWTRKCYRDVVPVPNWDEDQMERHLCSIVGAYPPDLMTLIPVSRELTIHPHHQHRPQRALLVGESCTIGATTQTTRHLAREASISSPNGNQASRTAGLARPQSRPMQLGRGRDQSDVRGEEGDARNRFRHLGAVRKQRKKLSRPRRRSDGSSFDLVRARQASERDGAGALATLSNDNHRLRTELDELRNRCQKAMECLGFALRESSTGDVTVEEWRTFGRGAYDQLIEPDGASMRNTKNRLGS